MKWKDKILKQKEQGRIPEQYFGIVLANVEQAIAKHILPIMLVEAEKNGITKWVEPFVGGANMIDKVPDTFAREGYDINRYLIALLSALANGWNPPEYVSKEQYAFVRDNKEDNNILTGWCGINLSYCGTWFGSYAGKVQTKGGVVRDYQAEGCLLLFLSHLLEGVAKSALVECRLNLGRRKVIGFIQCVSDLHMGSAPAPKGGDRDADALGNLRHRRARCCP